MRIKPCLDEDLDMVLALDRACFPKDAPPTEVELDYTQWWWVEDEGYVGLFTPSDNDAFLLRYGVMPSARRKGLGRKLTLRALRAARSAGYACVWTYVVWWNLDSLRVLQSCGFVPRALGEQAIWLCATF